ncbi:MAG TPA: hypothetical protein VFE16_03255 [Candidatus Cybelea sp.]|jgi:cytochrome c1|nr:hypothetical protein [Candidatus Cybelea sp.]
MKTHLLAVSALAAVLALPLGAVAQQDQAPAAHAQGRTTTPSPAKIQNQWARRFGQLNLSGDQQQRIQSLINQYSQAHPEGSARDRDASRQLRHQIMGVLSDDQRNQYHQQMRARREQKRQRQGQMQQGSQDQQYPQGPQNQQYQQGPQDQQYQQGPQGEQYQQGPPPNQQGPPPNE